jgi:hypothetical protein
VAERGEDKHGDGIELERAVGDSSGAQARRWKEKGAQRFSESQWAPFIGPAWCSFKAAGDALDFKFANS